MLCFGVPNRCVFAVSMCLLVLRMPKNPLLYVSPMGAGAKTGVPFTVCAKFNSTVAPKFVNFTCLRNILWTFAKPLSFEDLRAYLIYIYKLSLNVNFLNKFVVIVPQSYWFYKDALSQVNSVININLHPPSLATECSTMKTRRPNQSRGHARFNELTMSTKYRLSVLRACCIN